MRILQISDLHGNTDFISNIDTEITDADVVVLSGDLTNFAGRHKAKEIVDEIQRYNGSILAIPGNCDHRGVGEYLIETGVSIDRSSRRFKDVLFAGIGARCPALV